MTAELRQQSLTRILTTGLIDAVKRNVTRWRSWFPSEESEVEIPRADLLALVDLAEAYIESQWLPERKSIDTLAAAAKELPEGWSLHLRFTRGEAELELHNPAGDVVLVERDGPCSFVDSIKEAISLDV